MENKIDKNVAEFLNNLLVNKTASVKNFEDKVNDLKFDGENATVWQFVVLKSFDNDFSYLMPLANHLLDNNYCLVEGPMVKYAALNGYKLEISLKSMQSPLDEINKFTKECGFTEQLVLTNEPAQAILSLAKKIVNRSNDKDFEEVKDIFEKSGLDISNIKLMQKPNVQKAMKV